MVYDLGEFERLTEDLRICSLIFQLKHCEARFEKKDARGVHHTCGVYLILKERLFMPHGFHKEIFIFED